MRTLAATASAVCVSLGAVTGAVAADLGGYRRDTVPYYYPPPPLVSAVSWNGLYVGLQTGYVWGNADFTVSDGSGGGSSNPNGWVGGGYAGYNWQSGNFVLGFEADIEEEATSAGRSPTREHPVPPISIGTVHCADGWASRKTGPCFTSREAGRLVRLISKAARLARRLDVAAPLPILMDGPWEAASSTRSATN